MGFEEAIHEKKWRNTMNEEIEAIEKNDSWDFAILPKRERAIGVKWVFKTTKNASGEVERYNAILVCQRIQPKAGHWL